MKNKRTGVEGDFLEIEISSNRFVYARKLKHPSIGIYDKLYTGICKEIDLIYLEDILVKLCVFDYAITRKRWKIIGNISLEQNLQGEPEFWKKSLDLYLTKILIMV